MPPEIISCTEILLIGRIGKKKGLQGLQPVKAVDHVQHGLLFQIKLNLRSTAEKAEIRQIVKVHASPVFFIRRQVMQQHPVAAVFDWNIIVILPVRIDAHTGQHMILLLQKILDKTVILLKTGIHKMQIIGYAKGKFNRIIAAVIGKDVSAFLLGHIVDVAFLIEGRILKGKMLHKGMAQAVDQFKIHGFLLQINNGELKFNPNTLACLSFGRKDIFLI